MTYNYFVLLPASVRELLWEYKAGPDSTGPGWERTAIERVMLRGRMEDMRWLLATFGRDCLRTFLAERGRRVLPPRELRFWCTISGTPRDEADAWVDEARRSERAWRG